METLNRVHLRGCIGAVNFDEHDGKKSAHFSLCMVETFKDANGIDYYTSTWIPVFACEGDRIGRESLERLRKAAYVDVKGRLRVKSHIAADGGARVMTEVVASEIKVCRV